MTPTTRDRERWRHQIAVKSAQRKGLPPPPPLSPVKRGAPFQAFGDRVWPKIVAPTGVLGCWEWTATKHGTGYAQMRGRVGRTRYAHREIYEWLIAPVPFALTLDHLCRNRACVNPCHLEPVTSLEARRGRQTHCKYGHEFTPENTYMRSAGWRNCRECRRRDSLRANGAAA